MLHIFYLWAAVIVFAVIILSDIPQPINFVGIFLIFIGAYLIELKPGLNLLDPLRAFQHSKHLLMLLVSMTLYGVTSVLTKIILQDVSVVTTIFFLNTFLLLGYIVLDTLFHKENITKLRFNLKDHGWGVFWTALALFIARFNIKMAFLLGSVVLANAVFGLNALIVVLVGGTLLREKGLRRRLFASGLLIIGAVLTIL